jgi:hypothetical protein
MLTKPGVIAKSDDAVFLRELIQDAAQRRCHVNRSVLDFPSLPRGSGDAGDHFPGTKGFHAMVADGQGFAAAGWNREAILGCGVNGDKTL